MPMRDMQSAFHEEADPELTSGEVTAELTAHFAADADQAESFLKVMLEARCTSVRQLKSLSMQSLSGMVHKASMGDGTMGALGILVGTLKKPHKWEDDMPSEKKSTKGGKRKQAAEERPSRRPPMKGEYHLPITFDGVDPDDPEFLNILAVEVSLPHTCSLPCPPLSTPVCNSLSESLRSSLNTILHHPPTTDRGHDGRPLPRCE